VLDMDHWPYIGPNLLRVRPHSQFLCIHVSATLIRFRYLRRKAFNDEETWAKPVNQRKTTTSGEQRR
jgi:hypothetical protein